MLRVDIQTDIAAVRLQFAAASQEIVRPAIARALNRTATTVRADASRQIRAQMGSAAGRIRDVRQQIRIVPASALDLKADVVARGAKTIPLTAYAVRQTRRGITVRVGRKTVTIPSAFVKPRRGRAENVSIRADSFRALLYNQVGAPRKGRVPQYRGGPDYPIAEIRAPGVPKIFAQRQILQSLATLARTSFAKNFAAELKFRTERAALNG